MWVSKMAKENLANDVTQAACSFPDLYGRNCRAAVIP